MDIREAIQLLCQQKDLSTADMTAVMSAIMTGKTTPAQIAAFLTALSIKGETVTEITAAAKVIRNMATQVAIKAEHLVDIVGTGGDGANLFNISTAACFIVAAAGAKVAKHGNRSISSKSGGADFLETAGIKLELSPQQLVNCVDDVGYGFMLAPHYHHAMANVQAPRKEIGIRTLFNIIGPLTNPAAVRRQLLGVYKKDLVEPIAQVLQQMGSVHSLVVHSNDGLDEISIAADTFIAELKDDQIKTYSVSPQDFGIKKVSLKSITVDSPEQSFAMIEKVFNNEPGPARDIVALNAGAAIYASGLTQDIATGVNKAYAMIESGAAKEKLRQMIQFTQNIR